MLVPNKLFLSRIAAKSTSHRQIEYRTYRKIARNRATDLPSHKAYVCWTRLVIKALVQKYGRSGYTIVTEHAADLSAAVTAQWNALPAR
jgi:hypothetical protein